MSKKKSMRKIDIGTSKPTVVHVEPKKEEIVPTGRTPTQHVVKPNFPTHNTKEIPVKKHIIEETEESTPKEVIVEKKHVEIKKEKEQHVVVNPEIKKKKQVHEPVESVEIVKEIKPQTTHKKPPLKVVTKVKDEKEEEYIEVEEEEEEKEETKEKEEVKEEEEKENKPEIKKEVKTEVKKVKKEEKHVEKKEEDDSISFLGTKRLIENWDTNNGGKIGTIIGGVSLGAGGTGLGAFLGSTPLFATIGTMILPGVGTIVGTVAGGVIGLTVASFSGALIGSELGKSLDPHKKFIDKEEIEKSSTEIAENISKLTSTHTFFGGIKGIVRVIFNRYSRGTEVMSIDKLRNVCQDLGHFMSDLELKVLIQEFDENGDGLLQFNEFYNWYEGNDKFHKFESAIKTAKRISDSFNAYDMDHTGYLSRKEFDSFYKEFVLTEDIRNPKTVSEVLAEIDENNDGRISFNEFVKFEMRFKKNTFSVEKKK